MSWNRSNPKSTWIGADVDLNQLIDVLVDVIVVLGLAGSSFLVLELMARYLARRDERRRMGRK